MEFNPLTYFTANAWQGGPQLPDPTLGWVLLTAGGGHPGDDLAHASVRRWTAPAAATIGITATLEHAAVQGDGVRARIVSSRSGLLGEWSVHHGSVQTSVAGVQVRSGDTIDFIVDCRDNNDSDSFGWSPTIHAANGTSWSASAGFSGAGARSFRHGRNTPRYCWNRMSLCSSIDRRLDRHRSRATRCRLCSAINVARLRHNYDNHVYQWRFHPDSFAIGLILKPVAGRQDTGSGGAARRKRCAIMSLMLPGRFCSVAHVER